MVDIEEVERGAIEMNDPIYLSIVSGKGGVGKSTVAANLAVALARKGYRVGLIDADIYGFSVPSLMDAREEPKSEQGKIRPIHRLGVRLMSSGFLRNDNQPVVLRGPMLGRIIRNFLREVEWGELDYLLFDMPPGTGDIPLDLHEMLGDCKELLVTTPNETASEVAFRAGAMTARTGHELIGIVENMAYMACPGCEGKLYPFGEDGGRKLSAALRAPLLAQFPIERVGPDAPATGIYPEDSPCGRLYVSLADEVLGATASPPAAGLSGLSSN
jgi:ATP-binding protein involved in chromosome partitioning